MEGANTDLLNNAFLDMPNIYAIFTVKMGSAQSFKFAGKLSDPNNWMHGPEKVRFRDRGHSGIFRWGDFRLEVDED